MPLILHTLCFVLAIWAVLHILAIFTLPLALMKLEEYQNRLHVEGYSDELYQRYMWWHHATQALIATFRVVAVF